VPKRPGSTVERISINTFTLPFNVFSSNSRSAVINRCCFTPASSVIANGSGARDAKWTFQPMLVARPSSKRPCGQGEETQNSGFCPLRQDMDARTLTSAPDWIDGASWSREWSGREAHVWWVRDVPQDSW